MKYWCKEYMSSHYRVRKCLSQKVNYDKSFIYFGTNVGNMEQKIIGGVLGVWVSTNPKKYLRLPMMVGRRKKEAFLHYLDRFSKRVYSCNMWFLSMSGKEVFIKAVRQVIPVYTMQCFLLPKVLCHKLECTLNKFW